MFWNTILMFFVPVMRMDARDAINLEHGKSIKLSINSSVDPCTDFYSYACGNYAQQHLDTSYQEITSYMDLQYNTRILNLLETVLEQQNCQSFVDQAKIYFEACRTETQRNLTKYFEEVKPGPKIEWPILEEVVNKNSEPFQWSGEAKFDVWDLLGRIQSYGMNNVLINQEILVDQQGNISIMMEPAFNDENTNLPPKIVLQVLLMRLGITKPEKVIINLLETQKILQTLFTHYEQVDEDSLEMTFEDLEIHYHNLSTYVKELIGKTLPEDSVIVLRNPSYFQHLESLKKEQLCNYLMLKFFFHVATDSTSDFNPLACVKDLRNKFDLAVNFLYYNYFYKYEAYYIQPDIADIFQNILRTLGNYFKENYLHLASSQVQQLQDKLRNVSLNVGNLPYKVDFAKVRDFYSEVPPLDKNNYFKNQLLMLKHRFAKSIHYPLAQTHYIVNDNNLGSSSGAFYVPKQNIIILPFGSLVRPLYDFAYHDLYKYSLLGFILAHELAHAFDTFSLNLDSQNQVSDSESEDIVDNKNFKNSLDCLQSQLATDSLDERIADIVAIQVVYNMYESKCIHLQPHFLDDIWNKYFYLNVAQFFCGKNDIKFIDHDSDAMRLNEIVKNSKGFGLAFSCPSNSKLNPNYSDTCRVY